MSSAKFKGMLGELPIYPKGKPGRFLDFVRFSGSFVTTRVLNLQNLKEKSDLES